MNAEFMHETYVAARHSIEEKHPGNEECQRGVRTLEPRIGLERISRLMIEVFKLKYNFIIIAQHQ